MPADVHAGRSAPARIAVLASGRGSNLQAILDAIAAGTLDAQVVGVCSDRPSAAALARVDAPLRWSARPKAFASREAFDDALGDALEAARPDWIVCAGYMRILGAAFVQRFRGRLLNIHPSLLPLHRGLDTHARALAAGDRVHGASVHFVDDALDAGATIAQAVVEVRAEDSADTLAARVLGREHPLLVAVLRLAAAGRLDERDGHACVDGHALFRPLHLDCDGTLSPS